MKFLTLSLLVFVPAAAMAQSAPNPAQLGITSTATPEVVQVLDHTGAWVPIGSIASGAFTPIGGLGSGTGSVISSPVGSIATFTGATTLTGAITPGAGIVSGLGAALNGTGALVGTTNASLTTPNLNTPSAINLLHATGLPVASIVGTLPIAAGGTGVATLPAGPLFGAGTSAITAGTLAGNTTKLGTVAGSLVSGHNVSIDANSNFIDGGPPSAGGGGPFPQTVSGTTTSGGVPYFSSATVLSSSAVLNAGALMTGGGAGAPPVTITTGAGVPALLGVAPNAANGAIQVTSAGALPAIAAVGTATNNNAAAGMIGEYPPPTTPAAVALTTNVSLTVNSMSLTAGDWDVEGLGSINFSVGGNDVILALSLTNNTIPAGAIVLGKVEMLHNGSDINFWENATGRVRYSFAATTTVYLIGGATFTSGTCVGQGIIQARRVR